MKLEEKARFANRYELKRLLGRDGLSESWLANDLWTNHDVTIDVYAADHGLKEDELREFCGEMAGMLALKHPNILKPQHVDAWENMPYVIMAHCPNGSCSKMAGKLNEEHIWTIINEVASGLTYLHERGIVHQDIKPDNVLIDESGHYLITNIGISEHAKSILIKGNGTTAQSGTAAYMSPERFSNQSAPTEESDIWSLGATCFELVEGYAPFGRNGGAAQSIGADIPEIKASISDTLKSTIAGMMQEKATDRPTASMLVELAASPNHQIGSVRRKEYDKDILYREKPTDESQPASKPEPRQDKFSEDIPGCRNIGTKKVDGNPDIKGKPKKKGKPYLWLGLLALAVIIAIAIIQFTKETDEVGFNGVTSEKRQNILISCNADCAHWTVDGTDFGIGKNIEVSLPCDTQTVHYVKIQADGYEEYRDSFTINEQTYSIFYYMQQERVNTLCVNGVRFGMILVEGGTFMMGYDKGDSDEKPVHSVTMSDYYIGETEVTQALWTAVMGSNPSFHKGDANLPVENISWNDCQKFIKKLNSLTGLQFSLPTEAQWEYASKGGNKSKGYRYSGSDAINDVAWYGANSSEQTHPVGCKKPNELGLYDMSGNVWEWCGDWKWSYSSAAQTNPTGASYGSQRSLRGGSWMNKDAIYCRPSFRVFMEPNEAYIIRGMRLVRLID